MGFGPQNRVLGLEARIGVGGGGMDVGEGGGGGEIYMFEKKNSHKTILFMFFSVNNCQSITTLKSIQALSQCEVILV